MDNKGNGHRQQAAAFAPHLTWSTHTWAFDTIVGLIKHRLYTYVQYFSDIFTSECWMKLFFFILPNPINPIECGGRET